MSTQPINQDAFKLITKKSMALVNQKEIVLPSSYRVVFSMLARKNKVDIGAESIRTNEEISNEVYNHILTIDNNANRAIKAIENKDELELQKVLENTKKLKNEIESLKQIAYEDGLTKALNRKWLEENYLNEESETFKKSGVLVLIDLNDFKSINDQLSHAVGDRVLVHLVARLKKLDANVIRYGGDEFLILFDSNYTLHEVKHTVNVIRELQLKRKYRILKHELKIKFSYGIVPFKSEERFSDIIQSADELLYEDKAKVKARIA